MTRQVMTKRQGFGPRLKWWRDHRGLSQLDLAGAAEISQRHLSFLESARAEPSRDMMLRLAVVRRAAALLGWWLNAARLSAT
jgi:transcriptional regulator with XRE-family HTH domain